MTVVFSQRLCHFVLEVLGVKQSPAQMMKTRNHLKRYPIQKKKEAEGRAEKELAAVAVKGVPLVNSEVMEGEAVGEVEGRARKPVVGEQALEEEVDKGHPRGIIFVSMCVLCSFVYY